MRVKGKKKKKIMIVSHLWLKKQDNSIAHRVRIVELSWLRVRGGNGVLEESKKVERFCEATHGRAWSFLESDLMGGCEG